MKIIEDQFKSIKINRKCMKIIKANATQFKSIDIGRKSKQINESLSGYGCIYVYTCVHTRFIYIYIYIYV